jgi:hypothetical protein
MKKLAILIVLALFVFTLSVFSQKALIGEWVETDSYGKISSALVFKADKTYQRFGQSMSGWVIIGDNRFFESKGTYAANNTEITLMPNNSALPDYINPGQLYNISFYYTLIDNNTLKLQRGEIYRRNTNWKTVRKLDIEYNGNWKGKIDGELSANPHEIIMNIEGEKIEIYLRDLGGFIEKEKGGGVFIEDKEYYKISGKARKIGFDLAVELPEKIDGNFTIEKGFDGSNYKISDTEILFCFLPQKNKNEMRVSIIGYVDPPGFGPQFEIGSVLFTK